MPASSVPKPLARVALILAILCASPTASAGSSCEASRETSALAIAAIQQRLMVGALVCRQVGEYNRFVLTYRTALQRSDAALLRYFRRRDGHNGTARYHAYKTRLANDDSLRSARDPEGYCAEARGIFRSALEKGAGLAALASWSPGNRFGSSTRCPDPILAAREAP